MSDGEKIIVSSSFKWWTWVLFLVVLIPLTLLVIVLSKEHVGVLIVYIVLIIFNVTLSFFFSKVYKDSKYIYYKTPFNKERKRPLTDIKSVNTIIGSYAYVQFKNNERIYFLRKFSDVMLSSIRDNSLKNKY